MPDFKWEVVSGDGKDKGPTIACKGEGFTESFDDTFECEPRIPARAAKPVDVVRLGGDSVPIVDIVEAIAKLLITHRRETRYEPSSDEGADDIAVTEWVEADDRERWLDMIENPDLQIWAEDLGGIYEKLMTDLNRRPTSRSRRT